MALHLKRTLPNGVSVEYHRVVRVDCITNVARVIEVASYTSATKRAEEKAKTAAGEPMDVYMETRFYEAPPSDAGMSCAEAYAHLKTLPEFDGATDEPESDAKEVEE